MPRPTPLTTTIATTTALSYTHMITKGVIRLLPLAVFACYVAFLGVNVIEGEMQLSQFSVLINTVSMFGTTIPNIYNDINMIAKVRGFALNF